MTDREMTIGVCDECQSCDLMKYKEYNSAMLPYCTLFKTFYSLENMKMMK